MIDNRFLIKDRLHEKKEKILFVDKIIRELLYFVAAEIK